MMFGLSCALTLIWLLSSLIFAQSVDDLFAESGPVEQLSALYLLAAALWLAADLIRQRRFERWHLAVLALAAGLRELDGDKRFTDSGILSLRLYSGDFPLLQKVLGALVLALLLAAGLRLLRQGLRPWLTALRARAGWSSLLLGAVGLMGLAKTADGLGRKLASFGMEISEHVERIAVRAEESMEMFAALLILQAVVLASRQPARR